MSNRENLNNQIFRTYAENKQTTTNTDSNVFFSLQFFKAPGKLH